MKHYAIALIATAVAVAQTPAFEVASIKPHVAVVSSGPYERSGIDDNAGRVRIENLSLRALIGFAWKVP